LPWVMTNWLDVANTAPQGIVPDSVKYSFYVGGAVLLFAVLWTIIRTKEYNPEELAAFAEGETASRPSLKTEDGPPPHPRHVRNGSLSLVFGVLFAAIINHQELDLQLHLISGGAILFGIIQFVAGRMEAKGNTDNGFFEVFNDLLHMPKTMKQLAVVQFFSWFALFAMWIYSTSGVSAYHYGATDPTSATYNEAANWVGVLFAAYNAFAALAAFIIPKLDRKIGRKNTHAFNLVLGGAGLMSFLIIKDPSLLWVSMIGVGFAWASIVSLPYSILAGALPSQKMGVYMGIFNFFIVIPQILAASVLGLLVRVLFDGEAIYALILGGIFMIIAALMVRHVDDPADEAMHNG
ncbi:MAG: MFS transporter, partial [Sphingomonadales bacterium]|nr:MFS transporter [Sphingomonadales bacterium]